MGNSEPHIFLKYRVRKSVSGYGHLIAQGMQLFNQSPFNSHFNLPNAKPQAQQLSTCRIDPSVIEPLNEQQILKRNTTADITKLSELTDTIQK